MSTTRLRTRLTRGAVAVVALFALLAIAIAPVPAQAQSGADLREGAVFAMSNAREADGGNVVIAYSRDANGLLVEQGRYNTDGNGSGSFEDSANALVLGTSSGEAAPNNLIELAEGDQQLLFAVNTGSDSISVFQVEADGLTLVDVEPSGAEKPVSITINGGMAYVLHSGEETDDLFDEDGGVIANCTTGETPTLNGFELSPDGDLSPINGSQRRLSSGNVSGCAQVSFDPSGQRVVVTQRAAQPKHLKQQTSDDERLDDEGVIDVFSVKDNGRLGSPQTIDATGQGPFGFTFLRNGALLTTEQSDGPGGVARSTVASYVFDGDTTDLLRSSPSVQNGGTDSCWFVATDSQEIGFSTSFFEDGRISSYELDDLGIVRLIQAVASGPDAVDDNVAMGASDISLSADSQFLYQLNSVQGTVSVFANNGDGTLTFIEMQSAFPQPDFGPGGGMAAPMGLASN